jgi:RecA/RadA recombinase
MAKKEQIEKESVVSSINDFLKDHEGHHYNNLPEVHYCVKTGSLNFDITLDGGFGPGIHRFSGVNEGGKTSCALQIGANFQKQVKNAYVIYIKAEGRLDERVLARSGLDTREEKFKVIKSNECEMVYDFINMLIDNSKGDENGKKFLFIIDSMDALIRAEDQKKAFDESQKVAGGALMASTFLKKMSLKISELGHMMIIISQVRSTIDMGGHGPSTTEAGGNAIKHYASYSLEFRSRYEPDKIYENNNAPSRLAKGKQIGHWCKILFKKSINEKTGTEIKYPIKYGRVGGKSIWVEMEIFDLLMAWGLIAKGGAWFNFKEAAIKILNENGVTDIVLDTKYQGESKIFDLLESRQDITNAFFNYFTGLICKND